MTAEQLTAAAAVGGVLVAAWAGWQATKATREATKATRDTARLVKLERERREDELRLQRTARIAVTTETRMEPWVYGRGLEPEPRVYVIVRNDGPSVARVLSMADSNNPLRSDRHSFPDMPVHSLQPGSRLELTTLLADMDDPHIDLAVSWTDDLGEHHDVRYSIVV